MHILISSIRSLRDMWVCFLHSHGCKPFEVVPSSLKPWPQLSVVQIGHRKGCCPRYNCFFFKGIFILLYASTRQWSLDRINTRVVFSSIFHILVPFHEWSHTTLDGLICRPRRSMAAMIFFEVLDCLCEFRDVGEKTQWISIFVSIYSKVLTTTMHVEILCL